MTIASPVLSRLEAQLPLDGLEWDPQPGRYPEAAVLVPLTDELDPRVLLGRRGRHLKHHPGEIAFPGGKREETDTSPWFTARREAEEEVGITCTHIHPLGEMQPMLTRTGFEVHPCIARIPVDVDLVVDEREFDSVFYQPLSAFADPDKLELQQFEDHAGNPVFVPRYRLDGDDIWGVTAAILALVADAAYDVGLDLRRDWSLRP